MIVTQRTISYPNPDGGSESFHVYLVECERCGFAATSRVESDARAVVERHQARCDADQPKQKDSFFRDDSTERRRPPFSFFDRFKL